jgi:hypothetical protein
MNLGIINAGDPLVDLASKRVIFITAMGFEDRANRIAECLSKTAIQGSIIAIRYMNAKGMNHEAEFRSNFEGNRNWKIREIKYSTAHPHKFEPEFDQSLSLVHISNDDVILVDISAMSKFLILITLLRLWQVQKKVRISITTAVKYAPTKDEFDTTMMKLGENIRDFAGQPSSGVSAILRSNCLTSTRMQGQPTCAVAFTSFNEELIRHAIGTLNPRRLILINGKPPSEMSAWRASATQAIHAKLISEYSVDNPTDAQSGLLVRTTSTLDYRDSLGVLEELHEKYGLHERMIYFATGSKMQTVALAIHKRRHTDVHIEYPTPDSYFFQEYSKGVGSVFWTDVDG